MPARAGQCPAPLSNKSTGSKGKQIRAPYRRSCRKCNHGGPPCIPAALIQQTKRRKKLSKGSSKHTPSHCTVVKNLGKCCCQQARLSKWRESKERGWPAQPGCQLYTLKKYGHKLRHCACAVSRRPCAHTHYIHTHAKEPSTTTNATAAALAVTGEATCICEEKHSGGAKRIRR